MGCSDPDPAGGPNKTAPQNDPDAFNWSKFFSMVFWFLLHGAVLGALFLGDSEIKRDVETPKYGHMKSILYFSLMLVTGVLFVRASTMDPGWIVPPLPKAIRDDTIKSEPGAVVKMRDDPANGRVTEEPVDPTCRFCPACSLWQKLRSKHCNLCNRCVAKYDHHCFWMGNCIGEKNHGYFWWFLFTESALIVWTIALVIEGLAWAHFDSVSDFLEFNLLSIIVVIGILAVGWLPMALLGLHSYLIITNQTTWEFNRRSRITYLHGLPDGLNPFSRGCLGNIDLVCCNNHPEPLYWRGIADDIEKKQHSRQY